MKRHLHASSLCLCRGGALLFSGTMSVLTFLCLHIFKHQKQQKDLGGESDRHAITITDMFKLIQVLRSYLFNNFLFSDPACLTHCALDTGIFGRTRLLARHIAQARGISFSNDDDDDSESYLKSADEADKRWRRAESVCSPSKSGTSLSSRGQCSNNHFSGSTNNELDLLG